MIDMDLFLMAWFLEVEYIGDRSHVHVITIQYTEPLVFMYALNWTWLANEG